MAHQILFMIDNAQYPIYLIARTYSNASNDVIDFLLYYQTNNQAVVLRFAGTTFVPNPCTITIGHSTSGFDGILYEFRIFTGAGAIPGMTYITQTNCPQAAGIARGTHDPCFEFCSDPYCIECTSSTTCTACNQGRYLLDDGVNPPTCPESCPFFHVQDNTLGACAKCNSNQVFFNGSCLNSCPNLYIRTSIGGCAKCGNNEFYYNRSCVSPCPLATFANMSIYECQSCYLGCESCVNKTKTGCLTCIEGYFYYNNTCNSGCPPDMYADTDKRICTACQPPCMTCSQPNNLSCTSCPSGYILLNGTCVTSCPITHYQGFLGEYPLYQIPACLPKLILSFNLSLAIDSRVIYIDFSYGILNIILSISQRMSIQIGNSVISPDFYVLSPETESKIKFHYLGDQYYPPLSLLNATIDLDTDFNNDPYQKFRTVNKSATIQIKEIYPFTTTELQAISTTSNFTGVGGGAVATGQAVSSIAGGALSLSLVRMQVVGESVQLMRFFDIRWPPNVNQFFTESHIDPTSIILPINFLSQWNSNFEDTNTSMPRTYEEYEVTPFFTENFSNEISNLMLLLPIVVFGSLTINILKKGLQSLTRNMKTPKTNARKTLREYYIVIMQSFSRLMNRIDDSILWNFNLIFFLSIFQPGIYWSLLNIRYSNSLLEPPTFHTNGALVIGIVDLVFNLLLATYVCKVIFSNIHYVLQTKESLRPLHLKKYSNLFDDFDNNKRLQLLYVPLSLLRSFLFSTITALMNDYPFGQILSVWIITFVFILYMIIMRPLKDRWARRITIGVEIFAFGCMTFGLIFAIVAHFVEIDPTTLNEIGFAFITLSICSTFSGMILSLIQVMSLIKLIYVYVKARVKRRNEVRPLSLVEIQSAEALGKEGMVRMRPRGDTARDASKPAIDDVNLIKKIGNLSPEIIEQTPEGKQILETLRAWWRGSGLDMENETEDVTSLMRPQFKNRTILFFDGHKE